MTEAEQRDAVVAAAEGWLRTPYHHNARVKGVGVDCGQLPLAVYSEAGMIRPMTLKYARNWHLHQSEEMYLDIVRSFAREIPRAEAGRGDFAVWQFGRTFSHGGILRGDGYVIHAWRQTGVTLDHIDGHPELGRREARFFTVWG